MDAAPHDLETMVRWARPATWTMLGLVTLILLVRRDLSYSDPVTQLGGFDALAILFASLICLDLVPRSLVSRCSTNPAPRTLGRYSYAMYLFHQPVILGLGGAGLSAAMVPAIAGSYWPGALLFTIVSGILSLWFALLSWHISEKHFLRLKERFVYGGSSVPVERAERAAQS